MEQRTFYYRADGDLINGEFSYTETPEFFDDDDACDVIAEVYVKVKSRVLRMGEKELCDRCGGEGELPASTIFMGLNDDTLVIDCPDCDNGYKIRVAPPYEYEVKGVRGWLLRKLGGW